MLEELPVPTPEAVRRIAALEDPVIRNLQITQCYHELSAVLAQHTGNSSNWCTFATWASKQAGQTIRKEDLVRLLERRLEEARQPTRGADPPPGSILEVRHFARPLEQASAAVALGNKKVFAEIGYEFARFYDTCLTDEGIDADRLAQFSAGLRPGDPPEG